MYSLKRPLLIFLYCIVFLCIYSCSENGAGRTNQEGNDSSFLKSQKITEPKNDTVNVGIQPFGNFDDSLISLLKKETEQFYRVNCSVLKKIELPASAYYKPRNRYKSDSLLVFLRQEKPNGIKYIIGLTAIDISTSNGNIEDWGVFGLGFMPGASCVVSTFRLKPTAKSRSHLEERFIKVALHEIGHNFGLDHCTTLHCLMEDAEGTIKTVDAEAKKLCKDCAEKLSGLEF